MLLKTLRCSTGLLVPALLPSLAKAAPFYRCVVLKTQFVNAGLAVAFAPLL
jgi:hypothetical protein